MLRAASCGFQPGTFRKNISQIIPQGDYYRHAGNFPPLLHGARQPADLPGPGASPVLQRFLVPPADLAWRAIAAIENQIAPADFVHATDGLNLALVAACKSDQTAADARFAGRPNGALTYYLLQALNAPLSLTKPLTAVVSAVWAALKQADYAQEPQLTGAETTTGRAFLAK